VSTGTADYVSTVTTDYVSTDLPKNASLSQLKYYYHFNGNLCSPEKVKFFLSKIFLIFGQICKLSSCMERHYNWWIFEILYEMARIQIFSTKNSCLECSLSLTES